MGSDTKRLHCALAALKDAACTQNGVVHGAPKYWRDFSKWRAPYSLLWRANEAWRLPPASEASPWRGNQAQLRRGTAFFKPMWE